MTQNRVLWSFSKVCKINVGDEGEKSRSIKRLSKAEIKSSSIYQIIKWSNRVVVCVMILQKARSLACLLKDESTPFVKTRWKISSLSKKRQGFRAVFLCAQETKRRNSKNNLICGCEIEKREKRFNKCHRLVFRSVGQNIMICMLRVVALQPQIPIA